MAGRVAPQRETDAELPGEVRFDEEKSGGALIAERRGDDLGIGGLAATKPVPKALFEQSVAALR